MAKPIIGVDCDDVLVANFRTLTDWYNIEYGAALTMADNNSTDLTVWKAESIEQAIRQVRRFFETPDFKDMLPIEGAFETLRQLKNRYELMLFTARDHIIEAATKDWLEMHFNAIFTATHFTASYSLEGKRRNKAEVAVEEGIDYLIDDTLETIIEVADKGITAILFGDYPWNQVEQLKKGIIRCSDWQAVQEYFNGQD